MSKNSSESGLPVPEISEDRSISRNQKQIISDLGRKSFAEEVENDKEKAAVYIGRPARAAEVLGENNPIAKQELAAAGVYKRALLLVGSGGLQINGEDGASKSAADNNLPASFYLSHGGRVMIEIPPGTGGDDLVNWLTSGHKNIDGRSKSQTQAGAIAEGNIVYNRSAATHDVSIWEEENNGQKKFTVKEEKGFMIGAKDFLGNKLLGKETKHYGVDLAMNAEFGKKDSEGKVVNRPDGDHGHLYIHYTPSIGGQPATVLIGVEGAAPSSPKHSKLGDSDPVSPVGGSKFGKLATKKEQDKAEEYKDTIVPGKYGGMVMKLDKNTVDEITALKSTGYGIELAYAKPGNDPGKFTANLKEEKTRLADSINKSSKMQNTAINDQETLRQSRSSIKKIQNKLKGMVKKEVAKVKTFTEPSIEVIQNKLKGVVKKEVAKVKTFTEPSIEVIQRKLKKVVIKAEELKSSARSSVREIRSDLKDKARAAETKVRAVAAKGLKRTGKKPEQDKGR